jgi:phosphodiesterase/alkaline phosphatase D-like protein
MSIRKKTHRSELIALLVVGMSVVFLGVTAPAFAGTGYISAGSFGTGGSGEGQFNEPAGVAVDDLSGDVYVYDAGNRRVEWFDSSGGKFEGQFNGNTSPSGQFTPPATVSEEATHGTLFNLAIDNDPTSASVDDVYVVDPGHNVIDKFSMTGVYLSQLTGFNAPIFGVAVDRLGNLWVAEEGKEENGKNIGPVQEFDGSLTNSHITTLNPEKLRSPGLAVDSEQHLYLLRGEPDVVKFDKEGNFVEENTFCGCVTGVAVDSGTDELLADEGTAIARFGPFGKAPEERITGISSSYGVAVNGTTHTLYASQRGADTITIFDLVPLPDVTTGPVSEIQRTSVKLEGEVNPDGEEVTSCEFEYGTTTSYGHTAPCMPAPGSGTSPVPVSAEVNGLVAQTTYHYRLVAHNAHGPRAGADGQFTTLVAVEGVLTGEASEVQAMTATFNGSLEPNGTDVRYFFEYGPVGSFGSVTESADAGSATEDKSVSVAVSGLVPHQVYNVRLVAENTFGRTTGESSYFITPIIPPQIPGTPSVSFVGSQSAVLNTSLNPEHTFTRYHYEYGPCPTLVGCATVQSTGDETSSVYGLTGASQEISGLAPQTTYSYRLVASNEFEEEGKAIGGKATGTEGVFTTASAPAPSAETGGFGAVYQTSAIITGIVNPEGVPASYAFELGVYNGASTQYAVVSSGSAGSSAVPVEEALQLTGLQPGTTYAYRIAVSSGYIDNESHTLQGATVTFGTGGSPSVLVLPPVLAQLPIPNIAFPKKASTPKKKKVKAAPKKRKKKTKKRKKTH